MAFINCFKMLLISTKTKKMNLTIYFNSGNQVTIDKVSEWYVTTDSDTNIVGISIAQNKEGLFKCKRRLIVKSVKLDAIDCIVEH